ncbi:toxic anion resistance protein [Fusibacter bizertensis]
MGLNLNGSSSKMITEQNDDAPQVFNIEEEKKALVEKMVNSKEVDAIVSSIDVTNMESLVSFGGEVAEKISKASDVVLNSMKMDQIDQSSQLLVALNDIMKRFDINEIEAEPGFFGKIFGGARKQLDKILAKYHTMGNDVDKIYVELKKFESEIKESNKSLQTMFDSNVLYFQDLEKFILAGEQGVSELDAYILQRREEFANTGDNNIQMELSGLEQAKMLLEQRTHDLKVAENVAMQAVPMIRTMQFSNMNLVRKINSAFIITLPVFKQALSQAILLKRQKIQAEAMVALDEKTNELLLKNAQNTIEQSKITTQLASSSSVKIETLEATWQTICNGITETQQIQENARIKRAEDQARLNQIKEEFKQKFANKQ